MASNVYVTIPIVDLDSGPTAPETYVRRGPVEGLPVSWRDDVSGQLPDAVSAYLNMNPSPRQLELVIKYVQHHIHAPCWLEKSPFAQHGGVDPEMAAEIESLRQRSMALKTIDELFAYCIDAMRVGLDPL